MFSSKTTLSHSFPMNAFFFFFFGSQIFPDWKFKLVRNFLITKLWTWCWSFFFKLWLQENLLVCCQDGFWYSHLVFKLEVMMLKLKLQFFGHPMWIVDLLEKTLLLGKIEGKWRMGWQRVRSLGSISYSMCMNLSKLWATVEDRGVWHAAVHGVTNSWTWLRDWTATITLSLLLSFSSVSVVPVTVAQFCCPYDYYYACISRQLLL